MTKITPGAVTAFKKGIPALASAITETHLKDMYGNIKTRKEARQELADYILKHNIYKTVFFRKTRLMYNYEDGVYKPEGEANLHELTEQILLEECTTNVANEVTGKIARKTKTSFNEFKKPPENIICVENGVLDLLTLELTPHTPETIFITKLPITFNPDAECPKIKQFLKEVLIEKDIPVFQEFAGYCLYPRHIIKKAVLLLGARDTGKSTLINLLIAFLGEENIAGISLHKLSKDKFSVGRLYGKMANFYDDLSTRDFTDIDSFKMATGGGYMTGENKFEEAFQFKNYAKILYATNEVALPKDKDDEAYYSRWIVLRMDRQFTEGEEECKKNLVDELTTEEELQGFLNWALEGLQRVIKNQSTSYDKTPKQVKQLMMSSGDSISAFITDSIEQDHDGVVLVKDVYQAYTKYCFENERGAVTNDKFFKNVPKHVGFIEKVLHDRQRAWKNIKLRKTEDF